MIREQPNGCTLTVRVQPKASRTAILGIYGEGTEAALKVALMAPPIEGRANAALIALFADQLHLTRSLVTVQSGELSRNKVLHFSGLNIDRLKNLLAPYLAP
jgi:hypothetical protein